MTAKNLKSRQPLLTLRVHSIIRILNSSASLQRTMPSRLNAALLAALLLCTLGAPVEKEPVDSPAVEFSGGEEEVTSDLLSAHPFWGLLLSATARHEKEFEEEFRQDVKYHNLDDFKISSFPADCPSSNFSMEACLHRLAEGLRTYTVLLKHVEREYPGSSILSEATNHVGPLIQRILEKMKKPGKVTVPPSSHEEQLLRDSYNPDTFYRKMAAHSILRQLHDFLRNGRLAVRKREKKREANGITESRLPDQ